jgi:DNA-binding response OmpR family regulator
MILVVDDDLGFMAYLCMMLTQAGYIAVPALSAEDAMPRLDDMGLTKVDLLIVNLNLRGTFGLVKSVKTAGAKVISVEDPGETRIRLIPADGILHRTPALSQTAESEWLRIVRRVLGEAT